MFSMENSGLINRLKEIQLVSSGYDFKNSRHIQNDKDLRTVEKEDIKRCLVPKITLQFRDKKTVIRGDMKKKTIKRGILFLIVGSKDVKHKGSQLKRFLDGIVQNIEERFIQELEDVDTENIIKAIKKEKKREKDSNEGKTKECALDKLRSLLMIYDDYLSEEDVIDVSRQVKLARILKK
jgi:reverse gyrase